MRQSLLVKNGTPKVSAEKSKALQVQAGWSGKAAEPRAEQETLGNSCHAGEPEEGQRTPLKPLPTTVEKAQGSGSKNAPSDGTAPVSAIRRSQSLQRPRRYDGAPKPEARGHSRNASAVTKANDQKDLSFHRRPISHLPSSTYPCRQPSSGSTQSSRPASVVSNRRSVSRTSERSSTTVASNKEAALRLNGHKRVPSTVTRHGGQGTQLSQDRAQLRSQRSSIGLNTSTSAVSKPARPAFSPLQQHYSPKKTSRATTLSTIAHSPTKTAPNTLSPEAIKLQTELLQLHLLHRASAEVQQQWEQSAETKLRGQHEGVTARYREMRLAEISVQEQIDLQALKDWNARDGRPSFTEKIELLSRTIQDLRTIESAGGKYTQVVTAFERWIVLSEGVNRLAQRTDTNHGQSSSFVEGIEDGWKAEVAALKRRLTSRALDLKRLGQPLEESTLADIVAICTIMVTQMLEELKVMRDIEGEVMEREAAWVRRTVDHLDEDSGAAQDHAKSADRKAAWQ